MLSILLYLVLILLLARYVFVMLQPVEFLRTAKWCFTHPCWPRWDIRNILLNHFFTKVPFLHCSVMIYQILREPGPYTCLERWKWICGEAFIDLIILLVLLPLQALWVPSSLYTAIKRQSYERCRAWCQSIAYSDKIREWADKEMERLYAEEDPLQDV
jgi:hypothetical protein